MGKSLNCLRCGGEMAHAFTENIQLGKTSLLFGDWPNILAGAMRVEVWCCKDCGRLEFSPLRTIATAAYPRPPAPTAAAATTSTTPSVPFADIPTDGGAP